MEVKQPPACHLLISCRTDVAAPVGMRAPALEKLLAVGRRSAVAQAADALRCGLFGHASRQELPVAALSLLGEGLEPGSHYWLRADPVHFQLQRDSFVLTDPAQASLSMEEAQSLVEAVNRHFAGDGLALIAPHPRRWYLRLEHAPQMATTPLAEAVGRDVDGHLPQGADAARWRRWLNELQMLLHSHPVNQEREERGELPLNSVWLHGGGVLPDSAPADFAGVWAEDALVRGLAAHAGLQPAPAPSSAAAWLQAVPAPGVHLIALDGSDWSRLERDWCESFLHALQQGSLGGLCLHFSSAGQTASCRVGRRDLWKFWRRRTSLEAWLG